MSNLAIHSKQRQKVVFLKNNVEILFNRILIKESGCQFAMIKSQAPLDGTLTNFPQQISIRWKVAIHHRRASPNAVSNGTFATRVHRQSA